MAGNWIKMRTDLASDPAVFLMSEKLGVSKYEVVGMLHHFWSWVDTHSVDGNVYGVTNVTLDNYMNVTGFTKALSEGDGHTPWLVAENDKLTIPNFERHNGKSAKKRIVTTERVAKHREKKRNETVTPQASQKRYQRREEITTIPPTYTPVVSSSNGDAQLSGDTGRLVSESNGKQNHPYPPGDYTEQPTGLEPDPLEGDAADFESQFSSLLAHMGNWAGRTGKQKEQAIVALRDFATKKGCRWVYSIAEKEKAGMSGKNFWASWIYPVLDRKFKEEAEAARPAYACACCGDVAYLDEKLTQKRGIPTLRCVKDRTHIFDLAGARRLCLEST